MPLTEEYIIQRLRQAEQSADSDGTPRIESNPDPRLKCAAVLVPLVRFEEEWHLLFTRRAERVESHKGQVSFPGGACDEGETTPEETALREAQEEIGMDPRDVRLLGRLNDLITVTHYRISPVVGVIPWPYAFRVESGEVARVFTIPLLWLADRSHFWEFGWTRSDSSVIAYHPYDGELLWGASARMTINFLKTLGVLK
jgi:8-oxo-dGTP pyrophosphatase MutT (NUDIX family)